MANNIPTIKPIQPIAFNPATFTAGTYEYKPLDTSELVNSLSQMKEMEEKASDEMSAMDALFSELKPKVMNDDETNQWFSNYENKYKNGVQELAAQGNYAAARNLAKRMASEAAADKSLQGRMKWKTDYDAVAKQMEENYQKGEIDKDTYDWWKATKQNAPKYQDTIDKNGNIIGSNNYEPKTPYKKVDIVGLINAAFKMATPDKNSTSSGWSKEGMATTKDANGNIIYKEDENEDNIRVSSERKSSYKYEKVTQETILENMNELMDKDSETRLALEQQFEVQKWKYEQLEKQYDALSETDKNSENGREKKRQMERLKASLVSNGSTLTFDNYIAHKVKDSDIVKNMAYNWIDHSTFTGNSKIPTEGRRSGGGGSSNPNNPTPYGNTNGTVKGGTVVMVDNTIQKTTESANNSAKKADSLILNAAGNKDGNEGSQTDWSVSPFRKALNNKNNKKNNGQ